MESFVRAVYDSWGTDLTDIDRINMLPRLTPTQLECLKQLAQPVWDGNLISKQGRSDLVDMKLVERFNGINFCTQAGYCVLDTLKMLGDTTRFCGGLPKKQMRQGA